MTACAASTPERHASGDPSPDELDRLAESSVMALLLTEHPAHLTIEEVIRALAGERVSGLDTEDAADRLERYGLVHREGSFVIPSRTALRMDRLAIEEAKEEIPSLPA